LLLHFFHFILEILNRALLYLHLSPFFHNAVLQRLGYQLLHIAFFLSSIALFDLKLLVLAILELKLNQLFALSLVQLLPLSQLVDFEL